MKLTGKTISGETKAAFFDGFFAEFAKVPFGSMSKRDTECLLIKLLYDHALIDSRNNRAAADALGINETRLKGYLVDARYKYRPGGGLDQNIDKIIDRLRDGETLVHPGENGFVSFVLEDPVLRLDLAQSLKDMGHYADSGFNSELVKVKDYALLALLLRRRGTDHTLYKAIADRAGENRKALSDCLKENTSWLEKGKTVLKYVKDNHITIIELALGIAEIARLRGA
ncbi:MAG: hypothetical protein LBB47_06265 [Spirochaetaceae bacterium]|jgi:hypothetical protein|nr:hypothetical protein [Spirochaetaceae bacterium]